MDTRDKLDRSQLIIDINPDLRQRLEIVAEQHDTSLREYIETLLERIASRDANVQQRKPMSAEAFQELLRLREQIKHNHPGQTVEPCHGY